jgi:hypothetical protein
VAFHRLKDAGTVQLNVFLAAIAPEIVPFDESQSAIAFQSFKIYGKGIHPTARLILRQLTFRWRSCELPGALAPILALGTPLSPA